MKDQISKLKKALGKSTDNALINLLKSRLYDVFSDFMDVENIIVEVSGSEISVIAQGQNVKKVGNCY